MNKFKMNKIISQSAIIISMISAAQTSDIRHDSGLVGPGYYGNDKTKNPHSEVLKQIAEKNAHLIKTDVTQKNLDEYFCGKSVNSVGWAKEVFNQFTNEKIPAKEEKEKALRSLPADKVLAIHVFENKKTAEGNPSQQVTNTTFTANELTQYEQLVKITGTKSGFDFSFKAIIDLTGKNESKISFTEVPTKEKNENQPTDVSSEKQEIIETPTIVNVAIYSHKQDIPSEHTTHVALRKKLTYPS